MRPSGQANAGTMQRVHEAAGSWLVLWQIWNQFGPSPDGAVERDMRNAETRLREAFAALDK